MEQALIKNHHISRCHATEADSLQNRFEIVINKEQMRIKNSRLAMKANYVISLVMFGLLVPAVDGQTSIVGCAANCLTCFDFTSSGCMSCYNGKVLMNY